VIIIGLPNSTTIRFRREPIIATEESDATRFKSAQRRQWDAAAAGWSKWWETIEKGAQHVSDRLLELAEVQPGHHVLDVATGIGEPCLTAARRVGATGKVTGTDQSQQMLAIARERAKDLGLTNVELREMDAETLDLPEQSFDAVLCRWGLMFLPNLAKALSGIHRVLSPSGRFAATVWGDPQAVPMLSLPMGVVRRMVDVPAPPTGAPGPFSLADVATLEQAFTQAGFTDVSSERLNVSFEYPSGEAYKSLTQDVAAPIAAMLADKPDALREQVWQAIASAAGQYAAADGTIRMDNQAICVSGRR